jgi:hypothetical protein
MYISKQDFVDIKEGSEGNNIENSNLALIYATKIVCSKFNSLYIKYIDAVEFPIPSSDPKTFLCHSNVICPTIHKFREEEGCDTLNPFSFSITPMNQPIDNEHVTIS